MDTSKKCKQKVIWDHEHEQAKYIGRKGYATQNVMAVCDFNMCFTFA
jgi:hypothetical protein